MTWTYLSSAPGSSGKSWVRMRIGDTSSGNALLTDEEIGALLDSEGNKHAAAATAAETVGASLARKADRQIGKLRIAMAQASEHYFDLATRLRNEVARRGTATASAYAGGVSVSDRETDEEDADVVQPSFRVKQFDNPAQDSSD